MSSNLASFICKSIKRLTPFHCTALLSCCALYPVSSLPSLSLSDVPPLSYSLSLCERMFPAFTSNSIWFVLSIKGYLLDKLRPFGWSFNDLYINRGFSLFFVHDNLAWWGIKRYVHIAK